MSEGCKVHVSSWDSRHGCPWCRIEDLEGEIKSIRDSFQIAVAVKDYYWEDGRAPFNGEFSDISPTTARDMERWVARWSKLFNDEDEDR